MLFNLHAAQTKIQALPPLTIRSSKSGGLKLKVYLRKKKGPHLTLVIGVENITSLPIKINQVMMTRDILEVRFLV